MNDRLISWLRERAQFDSSGIYSAAANEIERLSATLADVRKEVDRSDRPYYARMNAIDEIVWRAEKDGNEKAPA